METTAAAAGHVKGNRSVAVTYAPRYRSDCQPWTSALGCRYSTPEVVQTTGPAPVMPEPAVLEGGELVRYEGSRLELHGTTWKAWGESRHPGLLRLVGATGQILRKVRPTSVVVI
jgi:hypothetical protein